MPDARAARQMLRERRLRQSGSSAAITGDMMVKTDRGIAKEKEDSDDQSYY